MSTYQYVGMESQQRLTTCQAALLSGGTPSRRPAPLPTGPGDLACQDQVIVGDIRFRIRHAMFQLDFKTSAELVHVDLLPVYAERHPDLPCFFRAKPTLICHGFLSFR